MYSETQISGRAALDKIKERNKNSTCCKNYAIIFMDLDMPDWNGYDTTKYILEFYANNEGAPAIVACTAFVSTEEKYKC